MYFLDYNITSRFFFFFFTNFKLKLFEIDVNISRAFYSL